MWRGLLQKCKAKGKRSCSAGYYLHKPGEPEFYVGRALPDMVGRAHPTMKALQHDLFRSISVPGQHGFPAGARF